MPCHLVHATVLALIVASLVGGRSLVANVNTSSEHVVVPGETLDGISRTRGVPLDRLVALNGLADPDALAVGQVLKLPSSAAASAAPAQAAGDGRPGGETSALRGAVGDARPESGERAHPAGGRPGPGGEYVVRAGDSLSGIARSVGVSARAIAEVNGLADPDRLAVGQRLTLPEGAKPPPASPPPSPSATAGPAPTRPLAARVLAAARAAAGPVARIGVAGVDLVGGQRLAIAADEAFPAASVAKLPILVEAYRQHVDGRRPLTDAARADLRRMIAVSDNDAANRLIDLLGVPAVNQGAARLGLTGTRLANPFGTARPPGGAQNQTTPADMARLLELLAADRLVSPAADRDIRYLLALNADSSKIRRGLPEGVRLAHKSGWFTGVANDVGIVTHARGAYVLAVFTQGIADPEAANDTVAAVTRVVHAAWATR